MSDLPCLIKLSLVFLSISSAAFTRLVLHVRQLLVYRVSFNTSTGFLHSHPSTSLASSKLSFRFEMTLSVVPDQVSTSC